MKSKSELFLMELIIVILFFSLSAAVCVQLFVKAHSIDEKTDEQYNTVLWCQNLAELYDEYEGDLTLMSNSLSSYMPYVTGNTMIIALDKNWEASSNKEDVINISLISETLPTDETVLQATITIEKNQEIIYTTKILHHIAERLENL